MWVRTFALLGVLIMSRAATVAQEPAKPASDNRSPAELAVEQQILAQVSRIRKGSHATSSPARTEQQAGRS